MARDTPSLASILNLPGWARPTHPIYRRELGRWERARGWRLIRVGCVPIVFVIFMGMGCLISLIVVDVNTISGQERILTWILIFLWMLVVAQSFINLTAGLIATALSSTVVSSEIESETYGLLRVTDVPSHEIILAKYAAAFRQLRIPLGTVIGVRLLLIVAALPTIDFAIRSSGLSGGLLTVLTDIPAEFVSPASVVSLALTLLLWLTVFAFLPALSMAMHTAIGLYASSITRTRNGSIAAAAGLRVAMFIGRQIFSSSFGTGLNIFFVGFNVPFFWIETASHQPTLHPGRAG